MTFKRKISEKVRALAYLTSLQRRGSYRQTAALRNISPSSVYRCYKEGVNIDKKERSRKSIDTRVRPKILSDRDVCYFLRTFRTMRKDGKNPTVKDIMNEAKRTKGSYRTYTRILNDAGYRKFQPRKRGLLSTKDKKGVRLLQQEP